MQWVYLALSAVFAVLFLIFVTIFCSLIVKSECRAIAAGGRDRRLFARIWVRRRRGVLRALSDCIGTAIVIVCSLCAVQTVVFRLSDGRCYAFAACLAAASGSMSYVEEGNSIPAGAAGGFDADDLVFIVKASEEDLVPGTVIAFVNPQGQIIVHRIFAVTGSGGVTYYVTRGDANPEPDPVPVAFSSVIGVYYGVKIPHAGTLVRFFKSDTGMATVAAVFYLSALGAISYAEISAAERLRCRFIT